MRDLNTRKYKHHLYDLILYLNSNPKSFAESIGLDRVDRIYNVLNGKNGISSALANKITKAYPNVSFAWLKSHEGDMIKTFEENDNKVLDIRDMPHGEQMALLEKEIIELKKVIENQKVENINNTKYIIDVFRKELDTVKDYLIKESVSIKKKENT